MARKKQKLELTWVGKDIRARASLTDDALNLIWKQTHWRKRYLLTPDYVQANFIERNNLLTILLDDDDPNHHGLIDYYYDLLEQSLCDAGIIQTDCGSYLYHRT